MAERLRVDMDGDNSHFCYFWLGFLGQDSFFFGYPCCFFVDSR